MFKRRVEDGRGGSDHASNDVFFVKQKRYLTAEHAEIAEETQRFLILNFFLLFLKP
jgi:hypothetical protein